jgi:hypothetical protein
MCAEPWKPELYSNHSTDAPLLSVTVPDEPVDCTSADHSATEPEPELLLAPLAIVSKPPVRLFVFTPLAIDASPILTVANTRLRLMDPARPHLRRCEWRQYQQPVPRSRCSWQ